MTELKVGDVYYDTRLHQDHPNLCVIVTDVNEKTATLYYGKDIPTYTTNISQIKTILNAFYDKMDDKDALVWKIKYGTN